MRLLFSVFVLAVAVFGSEVDEAATVQKILDVVAGHTKTNHKFSELEAAVLNAVESKEMISGRSPMAEIAAMTDMLIIECKDALETLGKQNKEECEGRIVKDIKDLTDRLGRYQSKWKYHKPQAEKAYLDFTLHNAAVEDIAQEKDKLLAEVKKEEELRKDDATKRKRDEGLYIALINEHDAALRDIKIIRGIIQNSKLDDRSHKTATVADAAKSTEFLELRKTVHPKLNNLVLLAMKATTQGSGIDLIYKLLYQTRDQVNESKNKVIKNEKSAKSNYKRRQLAFIRDIGDLYSRIAGKDIAIAQKLFQVYNSKNQWQSHWCKYKKNFHWDFTYTYELKCLEFDLKKCRYFYSVQVANLNNEKAALEKVAEMLVAMKWSAKVYNAIADVNLGVVYLHGNYNLRSALNRYMTVVKDAKSDSFIPRLDTRGAQHYAAQFEFQLQKNDLSYYIIYKTTPKSGKPKEYYLGQVGKEEVKFNRVPNDHSKWTMHYDTKSGRMFIKNTKSENQLFVNKKGTEYTLSTLQQTTDMYSQFYIERVEYTLNGCYKWREQVGSRLNLYQGASEEMNTDACYQRCKKMVGTKLRYFGLRSGKQCYCADDQLKGGKWATEVAPLAECGYVCPGRDGDLCGGPMRIIVHEVKAGSANPKKSTIVQRYKQEFCPSGYTTTGGPGAAITGCGIASCDTTKTSQAGCASACTANTKCKAYSWSPAGVSKTYKDKTVCSMYAATVPTTRTINADTTEQQTFCVKNK